MEIMTVKDISYSNNRGCIVLTCIDKSGNRRFAPATPTLSPKINDKVWVFRHDDLSYKGFNSIAVLMA